MDIQYFHEFMVLVETKNYWEASARLFIGQSTLSKHIKQMEEELGASLFSRTSRKVELTNYGKLMIPYAKAITEAQFSYTDALRDAKEAEQGLLVLGVIPSMAQYRITDLLLEYRHQYPGSMVKVLEDDSLLLKELLRQRRCELAFVRESDSARTDDADLIKIPYIHDHMVALLPQGHPLSGQKSIGLKQLQEDDFVLLKQQTLLYNLCLDACKQMGFTPHVTFACHRLDAILDLVTQGMGVSLLMNRHTLRPRHANFPDGAAFAVADIVPPVETTIYLCYRKSAVLSESARRFLACAEKFTQNLED